MNFHGIVAELKAERDRLDKAIAALDGIGARGVAKGRAVVKRIGRRKRRLTAAGRKRLSELLKKRWASGKMGKRKKAKAA